MHNPALTDSLWVIDGLVMVYVLASSAVTLVVIASGARDVRGFVAGLSETSDGAILTSPLVPEISVIATVGADSAALPDRVRALLNLYYPEHEVILVCTKGSDAALEELAVELKLTSVPHVIPADVPTAATVRAAYVARPGTALTVLRTDDDAGEVEALNLGVNAAAHDLVCLVEGDAIPHPDALVQCVKPMVDSSRRVVATGGWCAGAPAQTVDDAHRTGPGAWLALIDTVGHLRRGVLQAGLGRRRGLLELSTSLWVFRRDVLVAIGGYAPGAEAMLRVHRIVRDAGQPFAAVPISGPVCSRDATRSFAELRTQTRRRFRNLTDALWAHRSMMFRSRYGRIGLWVMPRLFLFEILAPVFAVAGVTALGASLAVGIIGAPLIVLFMLVTVGFGMVLTLATVVISERSYRARGIRVPLWRGAAAAALENLIVRPLASLWCLRELGRWARDRRARSGRPQAISVISG